MSGRSHLILLAAAGFVALTCLLLAVVCAGPLFSELWVRSGLRSAVVENKTSERERVRIATSLLASRAVAEAERGRREKALDCIERALKLGETVRCDRSCEGQFTRLSAHRRTLRALRQVLRLGEPDETSARKLLGALAAVDVGDSAYVALSGERAEGVRTFAELREGSSSAGKPERSSERCDDACAEAVRRALLVADEAYFLTAMDRRMSAARLGHADVRVRRLDKDLAHGCPAYAALGASMVPAMGTLLRQRDFAEAELGACRAEVESLIRRRLSVTDDAVIRSL